MSAQLREVRDPARVVVPALERLAAIVDGNDEMRGFFVEAGGVPRLSQLAASDLEPCKGGVNLSACAVCKAMPQHRDCPDTVSGLAAGMTAALFADRCLVPHALSLEPAAWLADHAHVL